MNTPFKQRLEDPGQSTSVTKSKYQTSSLSQSMYQAYYWDPVHANISRFSHCIFYFALVSLSSVLEGTFFWGRPSWMAPGRPSWKAPFFFFFVIHLGRHFFLGRPSWMALGCPSWRHFFFGLLSWMTFLLGVDCQSPPRGHIWATVFVDGRSIGTLASYTTYEQPTIIKIHIPRIITAVQYALYHT